MPAPVSLALPRTPRFILANARVPTGLLAGVPQGAQIDAEGAALVDLLIDGPVVAAVFSAQSAPSDPLPTDLPVTNLAGRHLWPGFVDMHTHLDKGHVIPRVRPDGTLHGGFALTVQDWANWGPDEMALRMDFALGCAHVHGVSAIRTHLDSVTLDQAQHGFAAFDRMRSAWAGRVDLQGVAITGMDTYLSPLGIELADLAARYGGVLGGVTDTLERGQNGTYETLDLALDRLFALATERGLDIDLHVDQTSDLGAFTIPNIAQARLRSGFQGRVVCGHCVNLSLQPPEVIDSTLAIARDAGLTFVSMPTPMMYLMDRENGRTPRWRGVTAAKEIMAAGLPLAIGGDNCRDAWFPYGDHDMLDTLKQAIRVFQCDEPLTGALEMASRVPADLIGRPDLGRIGAGLPANLVIFTAQSLNAVLCRDQADRIVLKRGQQVTDDLPQHHDLIRALGLETELA